MNVAVFGLGYVGTVTAACLANQGHRVSGVDTNLSKVRALSVGRAPVVEPDLDSLVAAATTAGTLRATTSASEALVGCDVSIICVGTPSAFNGGTDLTQVERVVTEIVDAMDATVPQHTVIIRSTVPPGTLESVLTPLLASSAAQQVGPRVQLVSCPEFLREGTGVADFFAPPFLVLGVPATGSAIAAMELFAFLDCPTQVVTPRTAESIKYACNAYHGLKVSFVNELSRLYKTLDVDTREVMDIFVQDRQLNLSPAYLRPGFAFGGSCLPKDLRSLLHMARTNSVDLPLLEATLATNELVVREVADRVVRCIDGAGARSRRVALLGLSFKAQTDDLRESPNVALAEILIGKGLDVRIHDPVVNPSLLHGANLHYVESKLPHLHRVLCDDPRSALDDADVAIVSAASEDILSALLCADPRVVIDLHGRLGAPVESLAGYQGVGW